MLARIQGKKQIKLESLEPKSVASLVSPYCYISIAKSQAGSFSVRLVKGQDLPSSAIEIWVLFVKDLFRDCNRVGVV